MLSVYRNILTHYILRRNWFALKERFAPQRYTDKDFFKLFVNAPDTPETFLAYFMRSTRYSFFFSAANRKEFFLQLLWRLHPQTELVMQAEKIMRGKISLLGTEHHFKDGWDWHLDWKSMHRFDATQFYTHFSKAPHQADVKLPWELSRFNLVWTLGKAYWTTNRTAYKEKFIELIKDWQSKNAFCYGINWANAMEVALRAANWMAGFYFFCDEQDDPTFWIEFLKTLFQHGTYIEHNLEYTRRSGNHLIANAVGLLMLGFFFKQSEEAQKWIALAKKILEEEILRQTYSDGMDYEMSLAYHCFVSEMLLSALILAHINKSPFSEAFKARLEKMFELVLYCLKPDGKLLLIGDSDDGKLFWFNSDSDYNTRSDLLATASVVFNRIDFKAAAKEFSEHALWHLGIEGWENFQRLPSNAPPLESKLFEHSQFAVLRTKNMHLVIDAGELGKRGWGGHGHNDTFSFELFFENATIFTDSGTYCYTADKTLRNRFRSTRAHNTVMIDGVELAEFAGDFKIKKDNTHPKIIKWQSSPERDELVVEHYAYTVLKNPVTHRRSIVLEKTTDECIITDVLFGSGRHVAELYLHVAPDVRIMEQANGKYRLEHNDNQTGLMLCFQGADRLMLEPYEIAPRYGVLERSIRLKAEKDFTNETQLQVRISKEN